MCIRDRIEIACRAEIDSTSWSLWSCRQARACAMQVISLGAVLACWRERPLSSPEGSGHSATARHAAHSGLCVVAHGSCVP
eukprot:5867032-Pyramimonas_sp.AAC.1